jgi:hypothetical protein
MLRWVEAARVYKGLDPALAKPGMKYKLLIINLNKRNP